MENYSTVALIKTKSLRNQLQAILSVVLGLVCKWDFDFLFGLLVESLSAVDWN